MFGWNCQSRFLVFVAFMGYFERENEVRMMSEIIFQKLTPTDDVEMEIYNEAFTYIFENADVKNVAISGPYGSGKSSLLETYKKQHKDKKFLHISLTHFQKSSLQNTTQTDEDIETILEGKILNQLIQQIKSENIPQTHFHIKATVGNGRCVVFSLITVLFVLCILHLKYFQAWSEWVNSLSDLWIKKLLQLLTNPESLIVSGIVSTVILGLGIYQLIKTQKNKNIFRKLNVQGNEIEIFGEDNNSYFDKYLNEVLYLFENSGVDVIVFEDLDRFDDKRIFERLREINVLSNIRLRNHKHKRDAEPLRFFYLLRDDMFVHKDRAKFFDFILPVVPVLDSSNAYDMMKTHFEQTNIFSKFDEKFLRGLSLYIDDMRILKNIYNEFMVYFNKLNTIELNPNKMLAMITYKNIFPRDFSDLQLNRGFVHELFAQKIKFISQDGNNLKEEIENKALHKIITRKNIDEIFKLSSCNEIGDINEYREIKSSEYFSLLKYLIRYGYIDESYSDYMTFFYENSLTRNDKMFLRSITDKIAKPYSYALDNVVLVLSNLEKSDFEQEETLNFDLFDYLLKNEEKQEILLYCVKQLENKERFSFVSEFFETDRERENLVFTINRVWPAFFGQAVTGRKMTDDQIREYSRITLECTSEEDLKAVNKDNCLTDYISSRQDYLALDNPDVVKICDTMKMLGVSFTQLDFSVSNGELFETVYINSLYKMNSSNICLMLRTEYHIENEKDAVKKCVSSVFSQPEQPLCKYAQRNMDSFLEGVLCILSDGFTDDSADAVMIINDTGISKEHKTAYIEKLNTTIDSLASINEVIYQTELLAKAKAAYTAENILEYFGKMGLNNSLIKFINSGDTVLDFKAVDNRELVEKFWKKCISCADLSLQKYEEIFESIGLRYTEFHIANIPKDRMEILIRQRVIPMTKNTLIYIRVNYKDLKMEYIRYNLSEYADVAAGSMISVEEIKGILLWDVEDEIKIKLLSLVRGRLSVADQKYSDTVMAYILKNNRDESDLPVLYQQYGDYGTNTKREIMALAEKGILQIIGNPSDISKRLAMELLNNKNIGINYRVDLFVALVKGATNDECRRYLELLEISEFIRFFDRNRRPKIPIAATNGKILNALKEKGFIKHYEENKEGNIYKIIRRKV